MNHDNSSNSNSSNSNSSNSNEHRDPELAKLFAADEIPSHRSDFWADLKADLGAADNQHRMVGSVTDLPANDVPANDVPAASVSTRESVAGTDATELNEVGEVLSFDRPQQKRRPFPLLAVAAAVMLLAGAGAWIGINRSETPAVIETANNETDGGKLPSDSADTSDNGSTSEGQQPDEANQSSTNYFVAEPPVTTLGRGRFKMFSPDNQNILITDVHSSGNLGCEGTELLTLQSQNLATGERQNALGDKTVETGGLLLKPLGPVGDDGRLNIAGTEFCDGLRNGAWTGVMQADGQIVDFQQLAFGQASSDDEANIIDDPFESSDFSLVGFGTKLVSPDNQFQLEAVETTETDFIGIAYTVTDNEGQKIGNDLQFDYEQINAPAVAWSPGSDIIAIGVVGTQTPASILIWDFATNRTGEVQTSGPVIDLGFDASGELLGVTTLTETGLMTVEIVNFGERQAIVGATNSSAPDQAATGEDTDSESAVKDEVEESADDEPVVEDAVEDEPEEVALCSGANTPIGELNTDGATPAAAATVAKIDAAAATCDWTALGALVNDEFTASFGGGDAIELWKDGESFWNEGDKSRLSDMQILRQLLREPMFESADTASWPAVFNSESCDEFTESDRASMARLDYTAEDIAAGCEFAQGYVGFRTAISNDGTWLYFVAGD